MRHLALVLALLLAGAPLQVLPASAQTASTLTRAEAVGYIIESQSPFRQRMSWYRQNMPPMSIFSDVRTTDWFAPYIEVAFESQLVMGNPNRTFRPNDAVRPEEVATMLLHLKEIQDPMSPVTLIAPAANRPWYEVPVAQAKAIGISIPKTAKIGLAIKRTDFFAMMGSAGVAQSDRIALTLKPAPVQVAAIQPINARVTTTTAQRTTTTTPAQPRVTTTVTTTQPSSNQSAKFFSISMPTLGVKDLTITHPSDPFTSQGLLAPLKNGVGHLFSYPGKGGKILIYGHSSSYSYDVSNYTKIFRQINKLNTGDKVYITYDGDEYVYEVTGEESVPATDMSRYQGGGSEQLILYTCWPPDSIAQRYLVYGKLVSTTADIDDDD